MSKLALLVIVLSALYYSVSGRTCVCAQFTSEECSNDPSGRCVWHEISVSFGPVKGDNGVCRTEKWMDCHKSKDCTIATSGMFSGNAPWHEKAMENEAEDEDDDDIKSVIKKNVVNVQSDYIGHVPDSDWPWDCESGKYAQYTMDVRPFDILAKKATVNVVRNNPEISAESAIVGKILGFIIFGVLIGAAICWKFGRKTHKKLVSQNLNEPESYSTF